MNNGIRSSRSMEQFYDEMIDFKRKVQAKVFIMREEKLREEDSLMKLFKHNKSMNSIVAPGITGRLEGSSRNESLVSMENSTMRSLLEKNNIRCESRRNANMSLCRFNKTDKSITSEAYLQVQKNEEKRKVNFSIIEKLYNDASR